MRYQPGLLQPETRSFGVLPGLVDLCLGKKSPQPSVLVCLMSRQVLSDQVHRCPRQFRSGPFQNRPRATVDMPGQDEMPDDHPFRSFFRVHLMKTTPHHRRVVKGSAQPDCASIVPEFHINQVRVRYSHKQIKRTFRTVQVRVPHHGRKLIHAGKQREQSR
jgi:hypothetical protein